MVITNYIYIFIHTYQLFILISMEICLLIYVKHENKLAKRNFCHSEKSRVIILLQRVSLVNCVYCMKLLEDFKGLVKMILVKL